MIVTNRSLLLELHHNQLKNNLLSPIWIIKNEVLFHQGKYYSKLYFCKNTEINEELKGVVIEVSYNNTIQTFELYDFKPVESYNNKNMFGAVLELPKDYDGASLEFKIINFFTKNGRVLVDQSVYGSIELTPDQLDVKKSDYLRRTLGFAVFPALKDEYWQCRCSKINVHSDTNCTNCAHEKSLISEYVNLGIQQVTLEYLYKQNPVVRNNDFSINKYIQIFKNYDIEQDVVIEYLSKNGFVGEYIKTFPLKITTSQDAKKTLSDYVKPLSDAGFNVDEVLSKYNIEELDAQINQLTKHENKKKKSSRRKLILAFTVVFLVGFYFIIGGKLLNYGLGYYHLQQEDFDKSIAYFESSEGVLDANEMIKEARYSKAIAIFEESPESTIETLRELSEVGFKDSGEKHHEFMFEHGRNLFTQKNYTKAIEWLQKVPGKESILLISQSYYDQAKEMWAQKRYKESIASLEKTDSSYLDRATLLNEYRYEYANILMNSNIYYEATELFRKLKDYRDSAELLKSTSYNHAMYYFRIKQHEKSLTVFNTIKGYKDTNAKITQIEKIVYSWKASIIANNSYSSSSDYTSLSKYGDFVFHFEISGGKPSSAIKLRYTLTWPDGDVKRETINNIYQNGEGGSVSWHYITPSQGSTGNLTFRLYNATTGELLGQKTVRITN